MTQARPGGRFERHPRLTGAALLAGALLLLELALRLVPPGPVRFAYEMRRVHGYSRVARVDLRPSQTARLRIERASSEPLFDFRLTTGPDGFRIDETRGDAAAAGARYLHAIGDSYTMGWGVAAAESWPERLAPRLEPGLRVLNLGVDGFGAVGATAKSRALAERFPPAAAVYLFSPNDLDDDVRALAVSRRGRLAHGAHEALDAVRRASYVAALPFALRYRLQFREGAGLAAGSGQAGQSTADDPTRAEAANRGAGTPGERAPEHAQEHGPKSEPENGPKSGWESRPAQLDPRLFLLPEPAALPAPPGQHPTFEALASYRDFLRARGARFVVLVLSTQPESLMALRFCRERGIEARLIDVAPALRIPGEGHFNAEGNAAVAALVERLLGAEPAAAGS